MSTAEDAIARQLVELETARDPDVVALAELASLAARIEPALVRELRRGPLAGRCTTATEADLWFSPLVEAFSRNGIAFDPACARVLRERAAVSPHLEEALDLIRRLHAGAPPSLVLEEELVRAALVPPLDLVFIDNLLRQIAKAFVDEPSRADAIAQWVARLVPRLPPAVAELPGARALALWSAERLAGSGAGGEDEHQQLDDLGDWRSILGSTSGPGERVGARLIPGGVELAWPPAEPAHEIDAGPSPAILEVGAVASEDGTVIRLARDQPSTLALTAFRLVAEGGDGTIRDEWLHIGDVAALAGHPAAPLVAALGSDGRVTVWDWDRRTSRRLPVEGVSAIAIGVLGEDPFVLAGRSGAVDVFEAGGTTLAWSLVVPAGAPRSISASLDRDLRVAVVTSDGRLAGWQPGTGEPPPSTQTATLWPDAGEGYRSVVVGSRGLVGAAGDAMARIFEWGGRVAADAGLRGLRQVVPLDGGETAVVTGGAGPSIGTVLSTFSKSAGVVLEEAAHPDTGHLVAGQRSMTWIEPDGTIATRASVDGDVRLLRPDRPLRGVIGAVTTSAGIVTAGQADRVEIRTRTRVRHVVESLPTTALGATARPDGVTFRVTAPAATGVTLCLFGADGGEERQVPMRAAAGGEWWAHEGDISPGEQYGFRVHGENPAAHNPSRLLLDPYALAITGDFQPFESEVNDTAPYVPRSVVVGDEFDWQGDSPPATPVEDTVLYEVHVKGATQLHPEIDAVLRGTYLGLAQAPFVDHLHRLGVTAMQLLPVQHFLHNRFVQERGLRNYWGYDTIGYFAPHDQYAGPVGPGGQVVQFKQMVQALHRAGIEVILDVSFDHTAEGGPDGPTVCHRGFDERYYRRIVTDRSYYEDFSGTGNTLDIRWPPVARMVLDSLRYWVGVMHVDGFRFNLATTLMRDPDLPSPAAPMLELIRQDPLLRTVKLIAEPWDVGAGGYLQGRFPGRWWEQNARFRDTARDFWRGRPVGRDLAEVLAQPEPTVPVNYVTSHDGFTLADLVSYNGKHNEANLEDNRDGMDDNRSWNGGVEGPTDDSWVRALRDRQQRNFLTTLMLSNGVPLLRGGDEQGHTQYGNNNAWCQDNETTWLPWTRAIRDLTSVVGALTQLRRRHPSLRQDAPPWTWALPDGTALDRGPGGADVAAVAGHLVDPLGRLELLACLNPTPETVFFAAPGGPTPWRPTLGGTPIEGSVSVDPFDAAVLERTHAPEARPPIAGLDADEVSLVAAVLRAGVEPAEVAGWAAGHRQPAADLQRGALVDGGEWGAAAAAFLAGATGDFNASVTLAADRSLAWGSRHRAAGWLRHARPGERAAAVAAVESALVDGSTDGYQLAVVAFGALGEVGRVGDVLSEEDVMSERRANEKLAFPAQEALLDAYAGGADGALELLVETMRAATGFGNSVLGFFDATLLVRGIGADRVPPLLDAVAELAPGLADRVAAELAERPVPALAPRLAHLGTETALRAVAAIDTDEAWDLLEAANAAGRPGAADALVLASGVQGRRGAALPALARAGGGRTSWYATWALGEHARRGSRTAREVLEELWSAGEPLVRANALLGLAKARVDILGRSDPGGGREDWPALVVAAVAGAAAGDVERFLRGAAAASDQNSPMWLLEPHLVRDLERFLGERLGAGGRTLRAFLRALGREPAQPGR